MPSRTVIIAAHALAGLAVTFGVWTAIALHVEGPPPGAATIARVKPFASWPAACPAAHANRWRRADV